jgi:hypothetical protein
MGLTLRVDAENAPYCVIRRLFGITKLHSSCLVWRIFGVNSGGKLIENGP